VKLRILIADDHAFLRRGLRTVLDASPDCEVCGEAANGQEAVEKAKELGPDVVIMDISMPILNGLEATRQIRDMLPHTEVLIVSMHFSHEVIRAAQQAGARGYLAKSDPDGHLIEALHTVHRHEPYFPQSFDAPR
jgi:DNA-binding NarL/FixJ family response regulator